MDKLLGKTLEQLNSVVLSLGMPRFCAKQIADWLYKKKVTSIDDMKNISLANRQKLEQSFEVGASSPVDVKSSVDGTKKYLFQVLPGKYIETVFIPDKERATLCVSSQIGCKMNCVFCNTGKQGFSGQLSPADIFNQLQSIEEADQLTNVVFMGMGEPMDNVDNLLQVLEVMISSYGYAWSPKRITVSTVGVLPGLKRFLDESSCHLAISLHNPFEDERQKIMPIQKAYPISQVIDLLHNYDFSGQRRVSFEYIVFKNFNDTVEHATEIARLLKGLPCRINLIRFHKVEGVPLEGLLDNGMISFQNKLTRRGLTTTIRQSRGEDIWAACGLLSTLKQNSHI